MNNGQVRVLEEALRILSQDGGQRKPEYNRLELRSVLIAHWGGDLTEAAIGAVRDAILRRGYFKEK